MATDKQHTTLNVPTLRFPEFSGEWKETTLEDISVINPTNNKISDEFIYIDLESVEKGVLQKQQTFSKKTAPSRAQRVLQKNDILFQCVRPYQKNNYFFEIEDSKQWVASTGYAQIRTNQNPKFIYQLLSTQSFNTNVMMRCTGSSYPAINADDLSKIVFAIPNIQEQSKIANLMSILDERILTQKKVIEKLQSLIGGIIHRVSCDGLKNGTWRMTMLSSVLSERIELNTAQYQVHSVSVTQGVINQVEYLGRSFAAKDTSNYHVVKYGDIVYTKSPTGDFPYGIIKQSYINDNVAVSPLYGVYKPNSIALGMILHHYFLSPVNAQNYLHKLIQKGAKNTINITNQRFLENSIPLPMKSIDIEKLATLLQLYDAKLTMENNLLSALHRQKMYLLSTMFI
jgi:type I restriction enzyme S subunit